MGHIEFEYPIWFIVPFIFLLCIKFCPKRVESIYFPGFKFIKNASSKRAILQHILRFLIVTLIAIALATPLSKSDVELKNDKGHEIALIMDASGSMREYNKFKITKDIVIDFLNKRKHDKIGLTIFADFAYIAVPLTYDKQSMIRLLKRIDVGVAGTQRTALYEALFLSANLFKHSHAKEKVAILLTDGIDNTNSIPLDVALKTAKKYGIKVYTVGVGNQGDFDAKILKKIASDTGGKFFSANSVQKLKAIYSTIDKLEKSDFKAKKYVKKKYYIEYPLIGALILLLVLFFSSYVRGRR